MYVATRNICWVPQLSRNVTAYVDILCDKIVVIGAAIKERSSTYHTRSMCPVVCFFDSKGRHPSAEVYSWITPVYSSNDIVTNKQDRQCTYNVTLRSVSATIVVVESNKYYIFWVCVCRLRYPACNVHAPFCHLWPAWLCFVSLLFLINGTNFEKKKQLLNMKCVFLSLSTNFVRIISHSTKNSARYDHKCILVFM